MRIIPPQNARNRVKAKKAVCPRIPPSQKRGLACEQNQKQDRQINRLRKLPCDLHEWSKQF